MAAAEWVVDILIWALVPRVWQAWRAVPAVVRALLVVEVEVSATRTASAALDSSNSDQTCSDNKKEAGSIRAEQEVEQ
jgi:hypothetical protein